MSPERQNSASDAAEQQKRFREALRRKSEEALERSHESGRGPDDEADADRLPPVQAGLVEAGRTQDVLSPRAKNSGKGKKTADKWNQ